MRFGDYLARRHPWILARSIDPNLTETDYQKVRNLYRGWLSARCGEDGERDRAAALLASALDKKFDWKRLRRELRPVLAGFDSKAKWEDYKPPGWPNDK